MSLVKCIQWCIKRLIAERACILCVLFKAVYFSTSQGQDVKISLPPCLYDGLLPLFPNRMYLPSPKEIKASKGD